ncbi:hypothetical protein P0Y35_05955 [Kiritimatiellaeota bacterium B1221]|nr:hypothetical protein [Kiritimatiellaeota bacterium B1221]
MKKRACIKLCLGVLGYYIASAIIADDKVITEERTISQNANDSVEFVIGDDANQLEFIIYEDGTDATVTKPPAGDWTKGVNNLAEVNCNDEESGKVVFMVNGVNTKKPSDIFVQRIRGEYTSCSSGEGKGGNPATFEYTLNGYWPNGIVIEPTVKYIPMNKFVKLFAYDVSLDPRILINSKWAVRPKDNTEFTDENGNAADEGDEIWFKASKPGEYTVEANPKGVSRIGENKNGVSSVFVYPEVVGIEGLSDEKKYYNGTSITLTVKLTDGVSLTSGQTIEWGGDAKFTDQSGLSVTATFNKNRSDIEVTAKTANQESPHAESISVVEIVQFQQIKVPNFPKCKGNVLKKEDFIITTDPLNYYDDVEIYGDVDNSTVGENTVYAKLKDFKGDYTPPSVKYKVIENGEVWEEFGPIFFNEKSGVPEEITLRITGNYEYNGSVYYDAKQLRSSIPVEITGASKPFLSTSREPIWSACHEPLTITKSVDWRVGGSVGFKWEFKGVDIDLTGSVHRTNSFTTSLTVGGQTGKKVGYRVAEHPIELKATATYNSQHDVIFKYVNPLKGFELYSSVKVKDINTKISDEPKNAYLSPESLTGSRCTSGCN